MWQHKGKMVDLSKKLPQAFEWTFFLVFKVFFYEDVFLDGDNWAMCQWRWSTLKEAKQKRHGRSWKGVEP
jgi:hypothetical protein